MKTPLAWLQLSHEKVRLLIALAGIGFADILMFMQFGFRDALFESAIILHKKVEGDIFLMSPESNALIAMAQFSERRLYQSLGVQGVESVYPMYIDFALWEHPGYLNNQNNVNNSLESQAKNESGEPIENKPKKGDTRAIMVIGINPTHNILDFPQLTENLSQTKLEDVVLFDKLSRPEFGPIPEIFQEKGKVETEAGGKKLKVKGLFEMGASFGADGNIITSDMNFLRLFPNRQKGLIDMGVIQLEEEADPEAVLQRLKEVLPDDVLVLSQEEFINFEKEYWQSGTAIGFIFTLGAGMGFIVGMVIVYQILYTDVSDHLPEYATLKAMGYTDNYLLKLVFEESLILSLIGYIPGFLLALILYSTTATATNLPVQMDTSKAVTVLGLTVVMCVGSGAIAVRRLSSADPADIF